MFFLDGEDFIFFRLLLSTYRSRLYGILLILSSFVYMHPCDIFCHGIVTEKYSLQYINLIPFCSKVRYTYNVTASDTGDRKEVNHVEILTSLIVAVVGGVICHYIIKWLDSDK